MHITQEQATAFDEEMLMEFLERGIPEGHHLDYKRALSGKSQTKQYHEFLKDISAFANANGGDILLGVDEPGSGDSPADQITGIDAAEGLARDLERLAASGAVDPRIPGLVIQPVLLADGRGIVLAHVPPSLGRPHMVVYDKRSSFHIRHSESVQQMTSFDIRQAVLTAVSAESQARDYLARIAEDFAQHHIKKAPGFILHASPIIQPETPIDVTSEAVIGALRDQERYSRHGGEKFGLNSMPRPSPTIRGVQGRDSREEPIWLSEYHRNGYIGVAFRLTDYDRHGSDHNGPYMLGSHYSHLFLSFAELCDSLVAASGFDGPYATQCVLLNAKNTYFSLGQVRHSEPYDRAVMEWPLDLRQTGVSFSETAEHWINLLYNAYGLDRTECNQWG